MRIQYLLWWYCGFIGYQEALLKFAYRKLLMMVIFLDKAKMERLMDNNPCLFVKTANVKVRW